MKNPMVVQAIVDKSGVKSTDVVLEIGPGITSLRLVISSLLKPFQPQVPVT